MYVEIDTELLLLAARGGDRCLAEVERRLIEMTPAERHALRQAIERLDSTLDGVIISERLRRIREDRERQRGGAAIG